VLYPERVREVHPEFHGFRRIVALFTVLASFLVLVPAAMSAPRTWPPVDGPGKLFIHFGEEHIDDDDGGRIFPKVVKQSARYRPRVVVASADKGSDGTVELLEGWKGVMQRYDRAGIPYFASVGNHDRKAPPGVPGGLVPNGDLSNYKNIFADRPFPFGDAPPYKMRRLGPDTRPAGDPAGASSHYSFDYGNVRWIIIDNSCFGITNCDPLQNPSFPDSEGNDGQFEFLQARAAEAKAKGMLVFVAMHMPTQDPRPGHTDPTPSAHTMGEGSSPDNALFEQAAEAAEVDGVFAGHVKGQWTYSASGVPYYTDGGAGGEVYVGPGEEVGTDYGYWHGYRLIRVAKGGGIVTDTVPVFVRDGITVNGPKQVTIGDQVQLEAFGEQPTEEGPEVEALELRDPDPSRPNFENLTTPARMWTTGNRYVLRPIASETDDPRRHENRQTESGRFQATCPGETELSITSGWQTEGQNVTLPSEEGKIVRSIEGGPRQTEPGRAARATTLRLAQAAEVKVSVRRNGDKVRGLDHRCASAGGFSVPWDGRVNGDPAKPGEYEIRVEVLSDRAPILRKFEVTVGADGRDRSPRDGPRPIG